MSTVETDHYIYTVNYLDHDEAGTISVKTWRAYEHLSAAMAEVQLWWTANKYGNYGTAISTTHNVSRTPAQGLFKLESLPRNYRGCDGGYGKQMIVVDRMWLEVDRRKLKSVLERER